MSAVLSFLVVVVPVLMIMPAVLLALAYPRAAQAVWARTRRSRRPRPPAASHTGALPDGGVGDIAYFADLGGPPLPSDVCDRCAVAAAAAVYLTSGRLLLCGHHGRQHQRVLLVQGAVVVGQLAFPPRRDALAVERSAG